MKLHLHIFVVIKSNKINKKLSIMKKYFAIIALVFASVLSVYGQHKQAADSGAIIVDMNKHTIGMPTYGTGRSVDAHVIIEACGYPSLGLVEVTLYNIGSASVRLINSNGQVVSSDYVQTDAPAVVYLDTFSTSGTFYLEVVSDTWYAEGVVTF